MTKSKGTNVSQLTQSLVATNADYNMVSGVVVHGDNISKDDVKKGDQILISYIIDTSCSIAYRNYVAAMNETMNFCKDTIKKSKYSIQVSITKFGDVIDIQPFNYIDDLDFSYEADGSETRFYEAITISSRYMSRQINQMSMYDITSGVIILTDGDDNASGPGARIDAISAIVAQKQVNHVEYVVGLLGPKENFPELVDFCMEARIKFIEMRDEHELRRILKLFTDSMSSGRGVTQMDYDN